MRCSAYVALRSRRSKVETALQRPRQAWQRRSIDGQFCQPHGRAQVTPQQFVEKWSRIELSERSASHQHFIDLCHMLAQPAPADHDATGLEYAFEKGVEVSADASQGTKGDFGFADVWKRDRFT
jgi:hypothetical protein